jgi:hypothetical protein
MHYSESDIEKSQIEKKPETLPLEWNIIDSMGSYCGRATNPLLCSCEAFRTATNLHLWTKYPIDISPSLYVTTVGASSLINYKFASIYVLRLSSKAKFNGTSSICLMSPLQCSQGQASTMRTMRHYYSSYGQSNGV